MQRVRMDLLLLALLLAVGLPLLGAEPAKQAGCSSCHDQASKLEKSAHAGLTCDTCHEKHESYPHPAGVPKPACTTCHEGQATDYQKGVHGQEVRKGNAAAPDCGVCHGSAHELLPPKSAGFRTAVPDTCGMCHSEVVSQFRASVHGQALARGISQAPLCTDCHGEHSILRHTNSDSPVNPSHIRETCGSCHGDVRLTRKFGLPSDRIVSFDASFHGLAAKSGNQTVANCASCHGVHNILASSDPKSTINAKNLPATCGRCHQGAGERFAISQVHLVEGKAEPAGVRYARQIYIVLIPLTIGLMLLHNAGDWVRKLVRMRLKRAISALDVPRRYREVRMLPWERVQHALMALSFITLVWSGFALKYPDQWWARPVLAGEGALRSLVHRIAAVIFMIVAGVHLVSLIVSRKLREHWKEMAPRVHDATEALQNFLYNLGLRKRRPARSAHSYIEKAEYWAVIWGGVIMGATGIMLWANNLMLKLLPKSWLDFATAIHFYEAVLATLAIVVWHFYGVIFDPDVYPLDTAFLTGVSVKEHEVEEETEPEKAEAAAQ